MIKQCLLLVTLSISVLFLSAQPGTGYNKNYHLLRSGNTIADKNFYLVTAINQSPDVIQALSENEQLAAIFQSRRTLIHAHATDTIRNIDTLLNGFTWTPNDSTKIDQALRSLYSSNPTPFDHLVNNHLRPSGYYQRFINLSNIDFLMRAWGQYFYGTNYIIFQFGLGKKLRYPDIDSASYNVKEGYFRSLFKPLFNMLDEQTESTSLFYQPSLQVSLWLMSINDRDEPARFEPLEEGENKAAVQKIKQTHWVNYRYTAILVPGEGPELYTVALSPGGKMRCELAAERFKKGIAPFIIVSGGYCHPFHTPYCEAIEMKKYLVTTLSVPENAIIIEPQARHTTTNFRNANRLMIRYNIPIDKKALCVTTVDQAGYIDDKRFDARNRKELGYLPYRDKQRLSVHESAFYPVLESLHMDPNDPLDP